MISPIFNLLRRSMETFRALTLESIASKMLACVAVLFLLWVAMQVLFAVAAYNDAKSKGSPDAAMWGLLIGFLGLVPGIIYLCVRSTQQRKVCCQKCGMWHSALDAVCPRCGEPNNGAKVPENPYLSVYARRAKKLLIAAVICLGVFLAFAVIGIVWLSTYVIFHVIPASSGMWIWQEQ